jgi:mono/diheme cytochrome c family protein
VLGQEAYAGNGCAGCHGASGGGGSGPAFNGGAIYETWPNFLDHFRWVRLGSAGWQSEEGDTYGANDKPVGGGMPGFGEDALSDAQLINIVLHERQGLGGENPNENDAARLELAAELLFEHPEMTLEEVMEQVDEELPAEES